MSGNARAGSCGWWLTVPLLVTLLTAEALLRGLGVRPLQESIHPPRPYNPFESPCAAGSIDEFREVTGRLPGFSYDPQTGSAFPLTELESPRAGSEDAERFLVLGDSFVQGYSVGPEEGFVELLNSGNRPGTFFYNAGVPGAGQEKQFAVLKKYFPVVRPHAVFLLFYPGNDFLNNLEEARFKAPDGSFDDRASRARMLLEMKRSAGCPEDPRANALEYAASWAKTFLRRQVFYRFSVGTVVWTGLHGLKQKIGGNSPPVVRSGDPAEAATRLLLAGIRDYCAQRGAPLYAAVIPDIDESKRTLQKSTNYRTAEKIFADLKIPTLDLFPAYTLGDYASRWPLVYDSHWNRKGHLKMFRLFQDCLARRASARPGAFCLEAPAS